MAAPNVPGENVVFQAVTVLRGQAGQAGLEIPKDVIVGVASGHGIQGGSDKGKDRLLQNVGLVCLEEGDVVLSKTIFELLPIAVHRAGGNCDVPIPKRTGADQGLYFSGHPGDLFSGGDQIDRGHAAVPGAVIGLGTLGEECFLCVVQRKRPMSFIV